MSISPFFQELRSAYQSEMDDLTFDSEGRNVLRQRLTQRRNEFDFLLNMIELSPEMVAVTFHQGFRFKLPGVMDHLLTHASDEFPAWHSLADATELTPWAQDLTRVVLKEPMGAWFLTVAAGLEYMYGKAEVPPSVKHETDTDNDDEATGNDHGSELDAEEEQDARAREDAGADWMVEQGFDRKD
jgi:hypothetical protein